VPSDKSPSAEIGKRFAEHLMKKSKDPHYDSRNETEEELNSMINEISLVHESKIAFPKEELYSKEVTDYLVSGIQALKDRATDYQNKKKELTELSNAKAELKNEGNSLEEFRKKLLDRCIDNMIAQAKD
jgi:polyhydroxyalkanoate synthesis regulator phasin